MPAESPSIPFDAEGNRLRYPCLARSYACPRAQAAVRPASANASAQTGQRSTATSSESTGLLSSDDVAAGDPGPGSRVEDGQIPGLQEQVADDRVPVRRVAEQIGERRPA